MFEEILKQNYNIEIKSITQIEGGWSALAYIAEDFDNRKYLLKVYEKSRASTAYLTLKVDTYMPIVDWLNQNTRLKDRIIHPLKTLPNSFKCEDEKNIYLLSTYINGSNLLGKELSEYQVKELASIVAELHSYGKSIPLDINTIEEDFNIDFTDKAVAHLEQLDILKLPLKELLKPFSKVIKQAIIILKELAQTSKESSLNLCLCHTDIHEGNILQNESGLVLIDWEGLKLAPMEADFFDIVKKDWQTVFFEEYRKKHPSYELNMQTLQFYQLRKVLEDIWEFVEQIQYDELTQEEEQSSLDYLNIECSSLKNYL